MKWAFWRRFEEAAQGKTGAARSRRNESSSSTEERVDPTRLLRIRARRRLIGAAALLLIAVVLVPMVLDPTPRPVADSVVIDIPSEKTPFKPRLSLPPVPELANTPQSTEVDEIQSSSTEGVAVEEGKAEQRPEVKNDSKADAEKARAAVEGKASSATRFALQAAALGNEAAARDLSARLKKSGFTSFTERVQTKEGNRWRVRVGPYSEREEAERSRARLRALGIQATVVTL